MSKRLFIYTFFFVFLSCPVWAVLTNESILKMIDAGLEESTILSVIEKDEGRYDLSVDGLIALKEAGVSETLIQAMLAASSDEATTASSSSMQTADDFQESSENRAEISIVPPFNPSAGGKRVLHTLYVLLRARGISIHQLSAGYHGSH